MDRLENKLGTFAQIWGLKAWQLLELQSLMQEVRKSEREACAKLAEEWTMPFEIPLDIGPVQVSGFGGHIAAAIRQRTAPR